MDNILGSDYPAFQATFDTNRARLTVSASTIEDFVKVISDVDCDIMVEKIKEVSLRLNPSPPVPQVIQGSTQPRQWQPKKKVEYPKCEPAHNRIPGFAKTSQEIVDAVKATEASVILEAGQTKDGRPYQRIKCTKCNAVSWLSENKAGKGWSMGNWQ